MQKEITPQWMIAQGFSITFADRFWQKVDKSGDCWLWTTWTDRDGYGQLRVSGLIRDGFIKSHRASWMMANGKSIPPGMMVLHRCPGGGTPACVNPNHLYIGDHARNMKDMVSNGRNLNLNKAKGEDVTISKLTESKVREIREKLENGYGFSELGRQYGVAHSTIQCVGLRKTWKHVL